MEETTKADQREDVVQGERIGVLERKLGEVAQGPVLVDEEPPVVVQIQTNVNEVQAKIAQSMFQAIGSKFNNHHQLMKSCRVLNAERRKCECAL
jgi:hypothetical protein